VSGERRPSLTPVLWARILARYGELGRPLTDAELQAIVLSAADTSAKRFAVTLAGAARTVGTSLRRCRASGLIADEVDSFERFTTTTNNAKAQAQRGLTMNSKPAVAIVAGADMQADRLHFAVGVARAVGPGHVDFVFEDLTADEGNDLGAVDTQRIADSIVCGYRTDEIIMTPGLWSRVWALYKKLGRTLTEEELSGLAALEQSAVAADAAPGDDSACTVRQEMVWDGALALFKTGAFGTFSDAVKQADDAFRLLTGKSTISAPESCPQE